MCNHGYVLPVHCLYNPVHSLVHQPNVVPVLQAGRLVRVPIRITTYNIKLVKTKVADPDLFGRIRSRKIFTGSGSYR